MVNGKWQMTDALYTAKSFYWSNHSHMHACQIRYILLLLLLILYSSSGFFLCSLSLSFTPHVFIAIVLSCNNVWLAGCFLCPYTVFFFVLFIPFMHHYSVNILMEYGVSNAILRFYRYFTHGYCGSFEFVTLDRLCKSNNWLLTLCVCSLNDRNGVWWCGVCVFSFFLSLSSFHCDNEKNAKKEGWAQGMTLTSRQITWF